MRSLALTALLLLTFACSAPAAPPETPTATPDAPLMVEVTATPPPTATAVPTPTPLPTPAPTVLGDGIHIVGADMAPGLYSARPEGNCYWARLAGFRGTLDDILANNSGSSRQVVEILRTDAGFESKGCGTWTKLR